MKPFFIFIFTCCLLSACQQHSNKNLPTITDEFKSQVPTDSSLRYFPIDRQNARTQEANYYTKKWAFETLFSLHEPVLYTYSGAGNAIRLTWLRSFETPIVVRANKFGDTVYVNFKELNKTYNSTEIPKVILDTTVQIDEIRWNKMVQELNKNNFWNAPYGDTNVGGKDGVVWFLEALINKKYHIVDRWDSGTVTSSDLKLYANELVIMAQEISQIKSKRGR